MEIPNNAVNDQSRARADEETLAALVSQYAGTLYRVAFSAPDDDLQVVRVIIPRIEFFNDAISRIGVRLRDHARASA